MSENQQWWKANDISWWGEAEQKKNQKKVWLGQWVWWCSCSPLLSVKAPVLFVHDGRHGSYLHRVHVLDLAKANTSYLRAHHRATFRVRTDEKMQPTVFCAVKLYRFGLDISNTNTCLRHGNIQLVSAQWYFKLISSCSYAFWLRDHQSY